MDTKDAKRILELARQWQDSRCWLSAYHHAEQCREQDHRGYAVANVYPVESTRHFEKAKRARQIVDARHAELLELANLLRDHAPKLLRLVPIVKFWNPPPDDLTPWLSAMREIEAEFLVLVDEAIAKARLTEPPAADVVTPAPNDQTTTKRATFNARMIDKIQNSPESRDWSASQWVEFLGCKSKSTVHSQPMWNELMKHREASKLARQMKRKTHVNRKPKLPK